MDKVKLMDILDNSPSIELLKAKNRGLILLFFTELFENETIVTSDNIHYNLTDFLENQNVVVDEEESEIKFSDSFEEKAKKYIHSWTNRGFLTNYQNDTGAIFYELSSHSSKTLDWLMNLKKQEYIGTESKFKAIFNQLKELVEFTNEDREKRLEILEDKKLEIEQQIQKLKMGEDVKVFEEYEIVPRFNDLSKLAKELLSDFKEVDDNFKTIIKEIYQKQTDITLKKGEILQYAFDTLDELKESSQGKSFYSFWDFLLSRELIHEWDSLISDLYKILLDRDIGVNDFFLKNMKQHLYNSGKKVYRTNDKMAEKLSRIIREKEVSRTEVTKNTIMAIKNFLIEVNKNSFKNLPSLELEIDIEIKIPFERKITLQKSEDVHYNQKLQTATVNLDDLINMNKIFNLAVIDKELLKKRVKNALREKSQITLLEIIDINNGISKGLSEVFGYIGIVKDIKHLINQDRTQIILFDHENKKSIKIPEIIFTK